MNLLASFGYLGIFLLIGLESVGIPLPGETALVTASIIAGTTHKLNIYFVILAAITGAIVGDNIGFWIGRKLGRTLLRTYGKKIGLNERRVRLGQYLFTKYGGKIVFFGRFFSLLRILAAFLAGANNMQWKKFLFFNAAGAIVWSCMYGIAGYTIGKQLYKFDLPIRIATIGTGIVISLVVAFFVKKNEERLEKEAELYEKR